ncbi:hypothetical protein FRB94_013261 [Tulasnella sp. JGI-2019a]|nr:hypothetical protein FRB93_001967 [Tulasnella sp. JGI-2019a]KAG9008437.1 hypothetical protein FRB94_013261 [Tulasnella sp. JGI-2019a]KAG9031442.1 hypothetical protein FRB95_002742 [Tulasnella sp. JGI-2019a]
MPYNQVYNRHILPIPSAQGSPSQRSKQLHPVGTISQASAKAHSPIPATPPPFVKQATLGLVTPNPFDPVSIPVTEASQFGETAMPSHYKTITCGTNLRDLSVEELRLADMFVPAGINKDTELCETIDGKTIAPSAQALKILREKRPQIYSTTDAGDETKGSPVGRRPWETEAPVISVSVPNLSSFSSGSDKISGDHSATPSEIQNQDGLENNLCKPVPPTLLKTEDQSIDDTTSEFSNSSTIKHSETVLSVITMPVVSLTIGEADVELSTAEEEWEDAKRDLASRKAALIKAKAEYDAAVERETTKFQKYCTLRLVSD